MNAQEFVDAVREDSKTPLSRLGASKALYADTAGEMDDDAVLAAVADRAHHAAETFEAWAGEAEVEAADLFATAAETERDHAETAADERGDYEPGDSPGVQTYLRGVEGTVERLGAFVGWALAAGNNTDQVVGYFVGQASPTTANTFRDVSDDHDEHVERASEVLGEVCEGDDWERAREAAGEAIAADYDDYFETLESLGVNPKPVC
ncbi:MAG: rubrerythrin family protein [Haloarculaceae archaeon]